MWTVYFLHVSLISWWRKPEYRWRVEKSLTFKLGLKTGPVLLKWIKPCGNDEKQHSPSFHSPLIRPDSCQRGLQIHGAQLVVSKLLRVSPAAQCPVLWKGWWALVSGIIHGSHLVWENFQTFQPLLTDEIDAHIFLETEPGMQMAEMSPHTVLFCRHCTKSVFHLANTPPEL